MTFEPAFFLIATAVFPLLGAFGSLIGTLTGRPALGRTSARWGLIGGCLSGAVLTTLLFGEGPAASPSVRVLLWTWFSFASPQPLSLDFGLEATWMKAGLVSLVGGLTLLAQWNADSRRDGPISENARLANSLLYAATTVFVFAPNLAQALLGWSAVSLLAGVSIRMARLRIVTPQSSSVPAPTNRQGFDAPKHREIAANPRPTISSQSNEATVANLNRGIQFLAHAIPFLERVCLEPIWKTLTKDLPNWIGEQAEVIQASSVSFQLLATVLCSSAVVLTWLFVG